MNLKTLLDGFYTGEKMCPDAEIKGIAYDSRKVRPGSLFVAIRGFKTDGHKYIESAVKSGAAAVIAEEEGDWGVPLVVVPNAREALAYVSAKWFGDAHKKLKLVGITGTNGKTTTTYLVKQILEMQGVKCGLIGTNQNMIGEEVIPTERTTPESYELHALFRQMADAGVETVVMEVSSHSLALSRVYGLTFEVGAFTNLTQDHLDFHKTMEEYLAAKEKLFAISKVSIINGDDPHAAAVVQSATGKTVTYGFKKKNDLMAKNLELTDCGVRFHGSYMGIGTDFQLGIPGEFSVYNALCAIGITMMMGVSLEIIAQGLILSRTVKGRAEVVPLPLDFTVIIDYAHTPDGLENIISTVRGFAKGRVITLFGCGGDRDRTKRPIMGAVAARLSDYAIVTSDNPRQESPEAIIEDITAGMKEYEGKYKVVTNRKEAIRYALSTAQSGDVVILCGKGHETYQIIGTEKRHFDEREVLRELVNEMRTTK